MKILVTGGSGFLGRYLVEQLEGEGHEVASLSIERQGPGGQHLLCDLESPQQTRQAVETFKPDQIYHLAGISRVSPDISFADYFTRNYLTTVNLVEASEALGRPMALFFTSTVHVYGNAQTPVTEASAPEPISPYGYSKYLTERYLEEATRHNAHLKVVVGRLYSCIGPGQAPGFVTPDLCRKILSLVKNGGQTLEVGPLSPYRRFLDARDAVATFPRLMEASTEAYSIYNIASPHELQIKDLLDILLDLADTHPKVVSSETSPSNQFRGLQVDTSKLEAVVGVSGFRPIEESLRDIWQWELGRST